jgi:hypothetical protein
MFFIATADAEGQPDCSYKGGLPGFVRVLDERTLAIPDYDGNGMYRSWGNVLANPRVGLLFLDFENPRRIRVNGTARFARGRSLARRFPRGGVHRARRRRLDISQLSALPSQDEGARALGVRASAWIRGASASLEEVHGVPRRLAGTRQDGGHMTIKLYSWPMSSGTRIAWALEELALPYRYELLDGKKQEHRSAEMLAVNPHGKVPALVDGDLKLFESGAILLYLGSRYGVAKDLWPRPADRRTPMPCAGRCGAMTEVGNYMMQFLYHGLDTPVSYKPGGPQPGGRGVQPLPAGPAARYPRGAPGEPRLPDGRLSRSWTSRRRAGCCSGRSSA